MHDVLRYHLAGSRTVHETMATETIGQNKPLNPRRRANNGMVVRRNLIEPGPTTYHTGTGHGRQTMRSALAGPHFRVPIDTGVKARRLVLRTVYHKTLALAPIGSAVG